MPSNTISTTPGDARIAADSPRGASAQLLPPPERAFPTWDELVEFERQ